MFCTRTRNLHLHDRADYNSNYYSLLVLVITILIFYKESIFGLDEPTAIEHYTVEQGLPSDYVNCIIQDRFGFIWIGTRDGLCRYDGYQFKIFRSSLPGKGALTYGDINCIYEDRTGTLWIGTFTGLNKYNRVNDTFTSYTFNPDDSTSLSDQQVRTIFEDNTGTLWIGTRNGLNKFNADRKTFTHIKNNPDDSKTISCNGISAIFQDITGCLWFGTGGFRQEGGGLNLYDPKSQTFKRYVHDPVNKKSLINNWVTTIYQDKLGTLWIGTDGGLDKFDVKNQTFTHFKHDDLDKKTINSNYIKCILGEGNDGDLLIGTWAGGLDKFNLQTSKCSSILLENKESDNFVLNVMCLFKDRTGVIWIGTNGKGLYKLLAKPSKGNFLKTNVLNAEKLENYLRGYGISSICKDNDGTLWFGTQNNGAYSFNPKSGFGDTYLNKMPFPDNSIFTILVDRKKNIWISTIGGLYIFDLKTKNFKKYIFDLKEPTKFRIRSDTLNASG